MDKNQEADTIDSESTELNISPPTILLFLALLLIFGMLLGSASTYLIGKFFDASLAEVMDNLAPDSGIEKRNFVRLCLLSNHIFLFVLPPLILAVLFYKRKWYQFLSWKQLKLEPFLINSLVGALLLLVAMPLVQFLYFWNKRLPLPDWARTIEENTNAVIQNLLVTEASWELFFNIFVIAIIPAIGEEMLFRGVLQKRLGKWIGNPNVAIWIAAAVFSLFHLQLEGFFPRLLLGAVLGYLFYWSKSLWIPIIVHFINNAITIVLIHFFAEDFSNLDLEKTESIPIWGALISVMLIIMISRFLMNFNNNQKENPRA